MNNISFVRWMAVCLASLVLAACAGPDETAEKIETGYPQARFPSYLKKPQSIEEIMPYAQAAIHLTKEMLFIVAPWRLILLGFKHLHPAQSGIERKKDAPSAPYTHPKK